MTDEDIKRLADAIHDTRYQWRNERMICRYCGNSESLGHSNDCVSRVALRVLIEINGRQHDPMAEIKSLAETVWDSEGSVSEVFAKIAQLATPPAAPDAERED